MMYILLAVLLLVCPVAATEERAGLFVRDNTRAYLHIPWENKSVSWEFMKKNWGIWNIYAVSINKEYISGTSGTDWEYVYYGKPIGGKELAWMGGNHGNEQLKTLEFFVDGKDITYGKVKIKNNLTIIETTDLVYPEGNLVVGSVIRKYVINMSNPSRFDFSQETVWHKDMVIDRAFICMLPIMKKHGRHFEMGSLKDSFVNNVRTDGRKGYQKVTETFMYGDNNWGIIAGIESLDAVENYQHTSGGAYIWDLSNDQVKLYYPRVVSSGLLPVKAGEIWANNSYYIVTQTDR
ncbi:MAG: hypothetical protein WCS44_08510 [Bacillota bacterium]|nr:hypothetical protein [Bacillota bacterium]